MKIIYIFILTTFTNFFYSQETAQIEILNSDIGTIQTIDSLPIKNLIGNVKLRHNGNLMYCDQATIFYNNNVDAVGNIKIIQPQGTTITGNTLKYLSAEQLAHITGNVELKDGKSKLYTNEISYNLMDEIGYFNNGGKIINDKTIINSQFGNYLSKTHQAFFYKNVTVSNPQYSLKTDTLEYNTKTKKNFFYTSTTIKTDSGEIFCNSGWWDENNKQSSFGRGTVITNYPQWILTDSIFYDDKNNISVIYKTYEFHDTLDKIHVFGDSAIYYKNTKTIYSYNRPLMIYETSNQNPLLLRANILKNTIIDNKRNFYGYGNVRLYSDSFQAISDTIEYNSLDSIIIFRHKPMAWSQNTQLQAELMKLKFFENKIDFAFLYNNAMIIDKEVGFEYYNQISADTINIKFDSSKIKWLKAVQNAKSIYFAKEDSNNYNGLNNSNCDSLSAIFYKGEMQKIILYSNPQAVFYPLDIIDDSNKYLPNFKWEKDIRPKNKDDL